MIKPKSDSTLLLLNRPSNSVVHFTLNSLFEKPTPPCTTLVGYYYCLYTLRYTILNQNDDSIYQTVSRWPS
jgi:hypothetical protein